MTEGTKSCLITRYELEILLGHAASCVAYANQDNETSKREEAIERLNYLNKRLKDFPNPDVTIEKTNEGDIVNQTPKTTWG